MFTGDEQLLYDKTFSALSPQQFKRLLSIGEWQDLDRGYVLHSTGDPPDSRADDKNHGGVLIIMLANG